jgi:hypothetical protein
MTAVAAVAPWHGRGGAGQRPNPTVRLRVADWMACAPGRTAKEDWLGWARGEPPRAAALPSAALPAILRRRITPVGQMAFRAAHGVGAAAGARFIFCSRHGEFRRTVALLETLGRGEPPVASEFGLSVHNALAGLLSIAEKNDLGHTAVAAGTDSFACGLLEAAACLTSRPAEPVLLVYFDEILPEDYAVFREGEDTSVAVALLLTAAAGDTGDVLLSFAPKPASEPARPAAAQALDFLRFLLSGESETISPGAALRWLWCRDVA